MVNINIYDSSNKSNDELNEIKNLLYQIIDENKTLNERISKYESYFKKFNKVFLENERKHLVVENLNAKVTPPTVSKQDESNLNKLQERILDLLPIFKSDTELEKYANSIREGAKDGYSVKEISDLLQEPRHRVVETLYDKNNNQNLVKLGLVKYFRLNPKKNKSKKFFYRISEDYKKDSVKIKTKPKNKTSKKKVSKKNKLTLDNEIYENNSEVTKVLYNNLVLNDDGTLNHFHRMTNRKFDIPYDIQDVYYIKSLLSDKFTWGDFHKLLQKNKDWNIINLKKMIYNIENNKELQSILEDLNNKISKCEFEKVGDFIKINDFLSRITPVQAQNWCNAYINSNKSKDEYVWELQKRFPEIDSMCIRIILYNIDNQELISTWKVEDKDINDIWIENNPSKRKNLIQSSGGII